MAQRFDDETNPIKFNTTLNLMQFDDINVDNRLYLLADKYADYFDHMDNLIITGSSDHIDVSGNFIFDVEGE
jgi:hypothetical protein